MNKAARVHLVDGTYELFRAHFSKRPSLVAPGGWDAKATAGFASSMLALLHDAGEAVTHVAVAFDHPIRSFRNDLFDGYKSDEGVPDELKAQFDRVEEAARALGMEVWSMRDFEADDGLATGARRFADEVEQVRILSPDKDLGQCLSGTKVVQVDRLRDKVIDEAALRALRGVGPESIPDLLALIGDEQDGIPGLPGFGEKSASALLGAYQHLDRIPLDASAWSVRLRGAERLAATLTERRDDALLYRRLATLSREAPVADRLEQLQWRGVPREAFASFCDLVGLRSMRERPTRWA